MATKKELEQELALAKQQLEQVSSLNAPQANMGDLLMQEMQALNKKAGRSINNSIPYKEIDDHRNIPLYTELNKVIGPMHPANAKTTMERFYAAGYPLFLQPRTPEQIEAYKQTDRYKSREAKRVADRQRIINKKPSVQIEKFARAVARETGRTMQEEMILPKRG